MIPYRTICDVIDTSEIIEVLRRLQFDVKASSFANGIIDKESLTTITIYLQALCTYYGERGGREGVYVLPYSGIRILLNRTNTYANFQ